MISFLYKNILRPFLFLFDPEKVHHGFLVIGRFLGSNFLTRGLTSLFFSYKNKALEQTLFGVSFKNPVGLSAGFDKDGNLLNIMPAVGFGFEEVGTITKKAYVGNPCPRVYRLKKSKALVVNYGMKNIGAQKVLEKIAKRMIKDFPIGISIGKTNCKETADLEPGKEDYFQCLKEVCESSLGNFLVINVSCPNAYGGEPFTTPERLRALFKKFQEIEVKKPVFIKMPINLEWEEFRKLLEVIVEFKIAGVTIGNLNKDKENKEIKDVIPEGVNGGISGLPTKKLSDGLIEKTYKFYGDKLIIVGVGGIFSAEDAYEKIKRGASLVQLITGMIYEGPQLILEINQGLVALLKRDGFTNITEAVGIYKYRENK